MCLFLFLFGLFGILMDERQVFDDILKNYKGFELDLYIS